MKIKQTFLIKLWFIKINHKIKTIKNISNKND